MASATLALPCAAYEVDPLKCTRCGTTMRVIALIDKVDVIERILKHLSVWNPQPETRSPARPRSTLAQRRDPAPDLSPATGYRLTRCPRMSFGPDARMQRPFSIPSASNTR